MHLQGNRISNEIEGGLKKREEKEKEKEKEGEGGRLLRGHWGSRG